MPIHVGRMEEVRRTSHSSGCKGARYVTSVSFVIVDFNLLSNKLDSLRLNYHIESFYIDVVFIQSILQYSHYSLRKIQNGLFRFFKT